MYSFLFLVFRTTAVVIQAAAIHDESKRIVPELFLCPARGYCLEVCKFQLLICTSKRLNMATYSDIHNYNYYFGNELITCTVQKIENYFKTYMRIILYWNSR